MSPAWARLKCSIFSFSVLHSPSQERENTRSAKRAHKALKVVSTRSRTLLISARRAVPLGTTAGVTSHRSASCARLSNSASPWYPIRPEGTRPGRSRR